MDPIISEATMITYKSKEGFNLHGALYKSKKGNKQVIIHQHGMIGNFFGFPLINEEIKFLKGSAYDLFSTNNRGFGTVSNFYYKKKKVKIGTALEKFEDCIKDVNSAIESMRALGYTEFILQGHSTGCQKVAYYQAKTNNPKVKALILLAPVDDYNLAKTNLGKKFMKAVLFAKKMVKMKKGGELTPKWISYYSAKRFLSYADPKNAEAQLFNYSGKLKLFSNIKVPVLAIFGSKERKTDKIPTQMLKVLEEKSRSNLLITKEIKGADHPFIGYEKETAKAVLDFLRLI